MMRRSWLTGVKMCNCMNEMAEKLNAHLLQKVPEGSEVSDGLGDTCWDNQVLSLDEGTVLVMLKYKLAYRAKKKGGGMAKNLSRLEAHIRMSFCPFCGERQGGNQQ